MYLKLENENCLVVGGGRVAERKIKALLESGADITVVSPDLTPYLRELKEKGVIRHIDRKYQDSDLEGMFLVISATDDESVNKRVSEQCFARKILVNVVDDPPKCSFFVPAMVRRGDLTIAISTGGKSPMLAARIREQLEKQYGVEYAELLKLLGDIRQELKESVPDVEQRRKILERIVELGSLLLLNEKSYKDIKELVQDVGSSSGS
ncbi:bifunctional precorrin-2 dehydrogenase/sirohydrochlorin ferrochelatase [Peptococcaceae bacterium]|nr:bifunctional precorrin-2 dehydrogenase/sirohydrochlorin ferrochelatase [Peptococcaceae bacterium]